MHILIAQPVHPGFGVVPVQGRECRVFEFEDAFYDALLTDQILALLFTRFNGEGKDPNHDQVYKAWIQAGHYSLSVGDIVSLDIGRNMRSFKCERVGWTQV